ncbi:hypothetical protein YC2023_113534 [Brassica napus]
MSVSRLFFGVLTILAVVSSILLSMAHAQSAAPAPAPTSDGKLKIVQNNNRPRHSISPYVGGIGPYLSHPLILLSF